MEQIDTRTSALLSLEGGKHKPPKDIRRGSIYCTHCDAIFESRRLLRHCRGNSHIRNLSYSQHLSQIKEKAHTLYHKEDNNHAPLVDPDATVTETSETQSDTQSSSSTESDTEPTTDEKNVVGHTRSHMFMSQCPHVWLEQVGFVEYCKSVKGNLTVQQYFTWIRRLLYFSLCSLTSSTTTTSPSLYNMDSTTILLAMGNGDKMVDFFRHYRSMNTKVSSSTLRNITFAFSTSLDFLETFHHHLFSRDIFGNTRAKINYLKKRANRVGKRRQTFDIQFLKDAGMWLSHEEIHALLVKAKEDMKFAKQHIKSLSSSPQAVSVDILLKGLRSIIFFIHFPLPQRTGTYLQIEAKDVQTCLDNHQEVLYLYRFKTQEHYQATAIKMYPALQAMLRDYLKYIRATILAQTIIPFTETALPAPQSPKELLLSTAGLPLSSKTFSFYLRDFIQELYPDKKITNTYIRKMVETEAYQKLSDQDKRYVCRALTHTEDTANINYAQRDASGAAIKAGHQIMDVFEIKDIFSCDGGKKTARMATTPKKSKSSNTTGMICIPSIALVEPPPPPPSPSSSDTDLVVVIRKKLLDEPPQ